MAHTTRALHLLRRAIAEVEDADEIERLRATCSELYADDGATLRELVRALDKRMDDLADGANQSELFPELDF
jgi:hypothetical protein